jgi:hypothetical protein
VTSTSRINAFALFRDSETTAIDTIGLLNRSGESYFSINFEITAINSSSHTYYVVQFQLSGQSTQTPLRSRMSYNIYA